MERRAFIALAAFAFIPTREHSDLKDLHERYRAAWADGREEEADALTFKLRNAIARKGVPDEWRSVFQEVAIYVVIFGTPLRPDLRF